MTSWRRWGVVTLGVALLVALPSVVSRWPTSSSAVSASDLLRRIQASSGVAYEGYAESAGSLSLPVTTSQISEVSDLLSSTTRLRVWWRGPTDWRVDTVDLTGEHDLHGTTGGTWSWDYEANSVVFTRSDDQIRLPQARDLVPASLGRRLLSQAEPSEVRRLPVARIAGHQAAGLRLVPSSPQSSIDHVDVWALASSGLPVRVAAYGKGTSGAVFTTAFQDLSTSTPRPTVTGFTPPSGARIRTQNAPDVVALADRAARVRPPSTLAGLSTDAGVSPGGSVGVYGRGLTVLVAIPLPASVAGPLNDQVGKLIGVTKSDAGIGFTVNPVSVFLTTPDDDGRAWLLTGTVTAQTLATAATQVPSLDRGR